MKSVSAESLSRTSIVAARDMIAELTGVTHTFDGYQSRVLTGFHLRIRRGEVLGLIGPRGAGKSTTLRLLAGQMRPSEGKVRVLGWSPRRSAARKRIGYVPGGRSRPAANGLFGFVGRIVSSGGQTKRARHGAAAAGAAGPQFAQALLGGRDLILLEEPFADLDAAHREECRTLLLSLRQHGKTVVFSSDQLTDGTGLCDRLAIIDEGRVRAVGTLEELLAQTDAVHFTAPVLPASLSERLRQMIRKTLTTEATVSGDDLESIPIRQIGGPAPARPTERTTPPAGAEAALAGLVHPKAATPVVSPTPRPNADPVDHEKLAQLTKTTSPPLQRARG